MKERTKDRDAEAAHKLYDVEEAKAELKKELSLQHREQEAALVNAICESIYPHYPEQAYGIKEMYVRGNFDVERILRKRDERTRLEALAAVVESLKDDALYTRGADEIAIQIIQSLTVSGVSLEKFSEEVREELQGRLTATEKALKDESRRLQQELTDKFLQELDGPVPVFGGSQIERFRKKVARLKLAERNFGYKIRKIETELRDKGYK